MANGRGLGLAAGMGAGGVSDALETLFAQRMQQALLKQRQAEALDAARASDRGHDLAVRKQAQEEEEFRSGSPHREALAKQALAGANKATREQDIQERVLGLLSGGKGGDAGGGGGDLDPQDPVLRLLLGMAGESPTSILGGIPTPRRNVDEEADYQLELDKKLEPFRREQRKFDRSLIPAPTVLIQTPQGQFLVPKTAGGEGAAPGQAPEGSKRVGDLPPTAETRNQELRMQGIGNVIVSMKDLSSKLHTVPRGIGARFQGLQQRTGAASGYNADAKQYEKMRSAFRAQLARAVGHVGVLTAADVEDAMAITPALGETGEEAEKRWRQLDQFLADKGVSLGVASSDQRATPPGTAKRKFDLLPATP